MVCTVCCGQADGNVQSRLVLVHQPLQTACNTPFMTISMILDITWVCVSVCVRQVVHVSPDLRKAYIGDSSDLTANGKSIMAFNKSWRSLPIQSWSGGMKIAGPYLHCHALCRSMPSASAPTGTYMRSSGMLVATLIPEMHGCFKDVALRMF